jgi:hypothetical protein
MAGAKKPDKMPTRSLISLKGDPSWLEWLKELADWVGVPASTAIDLGLIELAKRRGFRKPMPSRLPASHTKLKEN